MKLDDILAREGRAINMIPQVIEHLGATIRTYSMACWWS
jgi:hypothetical protein